MTERRTETREGGGGGVAVFLCRCGPNIADHLDLELLERWAADQSDVTLVECHDLYCAPAGKQAFSEALAGRPWDGVVMAACSPQMHEKTFQTLAEEAGVNIGRVQMANIREHCAWVTRDRQEATHKAQALIRAAVRRLRHAEELELRSMPICPDLLVIGGGIAGIEAALLAARAGRRVTIVERDISIGGAVIRIEEVAPTMECGPCLLAPRLAEVKDEPLIDVITNAEVEKIVGFYGNFEATIKKKARFVADNCIGCEACFDVCPVELPSAFHLGMGTHKAIYTLFPGSVPAAAQIDAEHCLHFKEEGCNACVPECPFESIDFTHRDEILQLQIGGVLLATGFSGADVSWVEELGHGRFPEVYTLSEFERILASNGPTGGKLQRRDGSEPRSLAIVHCAGSRRSDGLPYCSGICCVNGLKVGVLARAGVEGLVVTHVFDQLVLPGPKEEQLFRRAEGEGAKLVRTASISRVRVDGGDGGLRVDGEDFEAFSAEMVVLLNGMAPADSASRIGEMLHLERDGQGFFVADHDLLHATGSAIDGVYLAGAAGGPCNVSTAVTRGRAAAGDALSRLVPGREITLETMTATIDAEICGRCKLCIASCPYHAITRRDDGAAEVNEAICRGCGTCAATCPSGACEARHYTDQQIYAEIGGLIDE